jgi:hypothetical protein
LSRDDEGRVMREEEEEEEDGGQCVLLLHFGFVATAQAIHY